MILKIGGFKFDLFMVEVGSKNLNEIEYVSKLNKKKRVLNFDDKKFFLYNTNYSTLIKKIEQS